MGLLLDACLEGHCGVEGSGRCGVKEGSGNGTQSLNTLDQKEAACTVRPLYALNEHRVMTCRGKSEVMWVTWSP